MDTSDFNFIFLGQSVLKYQVPLDVFNTINHIYETKYHELKPANKQLVGKIEKEHSLFFNGDDSPRMTNIIIYLIMYYNGLNKNLDTI